MPFNIIDQKLLHQLQVDFPLTREPYADLGLRLGITQDEVIHRLEQLKTKGIIRQISPVLDARKLGYETALVAMKVAKARLGIAVRVIRAHPGISHGYEREHQFNLWITLAAPQEVGIETELEQLASATGAEASFALPAVKVFKLRTYFAMGDNNHREADTRVGVDLPSQPVELSPIDRQIINEIQQDLPLIPHPFADMSAKSGIDEEKFLAVCQSLLWRGVIRRFGASLNHRKAGFKANAMTCWVVPPEKVEVAGKKLASLPEVSHCYERKTNSLWRYNLFAMLHARTKESCQQIADKVSSEASLKDSVLLFSTREIKKTRVKYLV